MKKMLHFLCCYHSALISSSLKVFRLFCPIRIIVLTLFFVMLVFCFTTCKPFAAAVFPGESKSRKNVWKQECQTIIQTRFFACGEKKKRQKTLEEKYDISKNLEWQGEKEKMVVPCLSKHKGASNVIVRQHDQNKEERYLLIFTQCIGCAALCHRISQMLKVYMSSKPTTQVEFGKNNRKKPSRTRIQRPHQFVATYSEQGAEL